MNVVRETMKPFIICMVDIANFSTVCLLPSLELRITYFFANVTFIAFCGVIWNPLVALFAIAACAMEINMEK
jgi:hypothetical protein